MLPPGWRALRFDTLDSTNDEARRRAEAGEPDDDGALVVSAAAQTAGRGRGGRSWSSQTGNLHLSLLLRPRVPFAQVALASFVAALGVVEGVADLAPGLDLRCKWPNDVLAGGRKLCGILLEAEEAMAERPAWLVIGIGVNVGYAPDLPGLLYPATSLRALGCEAGVDRVLEQVCRRLHMWWTTWNEQGFAPVREAWLARAAGLGKPVTVRLDGGTVVGTFAGLDLDGALLLDVEGTGRRRVLAGDVFFGEGKRKDERP
ncbi:MAG: biotin--[acetyl-CoA-carboxylase] ligase [Alphaproteobacteria bacterium]